MLELKDIDKTKLSEPVSQILEALELKHAKVPYYLVVTAVPSTYKPEHWQLRFHDGRFAEDEVDWVGAVEYTYGKRSDHEYKITSRKIQNDRFGQWGNEHSSQRTKDLKKAVKIAMTNLLPFEWHEISAKGRRDAEKAHERWVSEDNKAIYPFKVSHEVIYEELKHLVKQGVVFQTDAFKNAAAGIADYEEMLRKAQIKPKFDTVMVRPDKTIFIPNGRALQYEISDFDTLPENTRNSIALLKLVGKDSLLPEVGYRAGENTYFILG